MDFDVRLLLKIFDDFYILCFLKLFNILKEIKNKKTEKFKTYI